MTGENWVRIAALFAVVGAVRLLLRYRPWKLVMQRWLRK